MDYNDIGVLSECLKKGDEKAYAFLMDTYYQKLCSYANTLTNDSGKSEDIVQNVMVKLWIKRKKINFNISVRSYLYKSVYNEFIDQFRKKVEVVYLEKKYIEAVDQVIENHGVDFDKLMVKVNEEINKLPKQCKKVFLLNKKDGLTHSEIAEHLNLSVKTIEGHMTKAFKILKEQLGESVKPILFMLFEFKIEAKKLNV